MMEISTGSKNISHRMILAPQDHDTVPLAGTCTFTVTSDNGNRAASAKLNMQGFDWSWSSTHVTSSTRAISWTRPKRGYGYSAVAQAKVHPRPNMRTYSTHTTKYTRQKEGLGRKVLLSCYNTSHFLFTCKQVFTTINSTLQTVPVFHNQDVEIRRL